MRQKEEKKNYFFLKRKEYSTNEKHEKTLMCLIRTYCWWLSVSLTGYLFVSEVWSMECHSSDRETVTFTMSDEPEKFGCERKLFQGEREG